MKLKNYWKRFWTLDRHHAAGFTLVELIVVIAILAILAGVGIPVYSGYITKANKQADMTLTGEVSNALLLHSYAHPETIGGFVVLRQKGAAASASNDEMTAAMHAVFGAGWENNLSLKYDGWIKDTVLSAALSRADIAAIANSPFLQKADTADLLNNIQDLTSSAFEFFGDRTAENKLNKLNLYDEAFVDFCEENGLNLELSADGSAFKNASDAQLSNLMGLYAAQHVGNMTAPDYVSLLLYTLDPAHGTENPGNNAVNPQLSTVTLLASQYAMLKAISVHDGEEGAKKMAAIDKALSEADSMLAVTNAMGMYFGGADGIVDAEEQEAAMIKYVNEDYYPIFESDMNGISAMMGAASAASGSLFDDAKDLDTNDFYLTSNISNAADTIRGVAGMTSEERAALNTAISNLQNGEILVLLLADSAFITVSPMAANPSVQ